MMPGPCRNWTVYCGHLIRRILSNTIMHCLGLVFLKDFSCNQFPLFFSMKSFALFSISYLLIISFCVFKHLPLASVSVTKYSPSISPSRWMDVFLNRVFFWSTTSPSGLYISSWQMPGTLFSAFIVQKSCAGLG